MRCKNCGWENPDDFKRCEKCNTSLEGVSFNAAPAATPQNFNKTVNEAVVFPNSPAMDANVCPKCGSKNLNKIDRMNGYLAYSRVKGDSRLADHKMEEIKDRVSM